VTRIGGYLLIRVMVTDLHNGSTLIAPLVGALAVLTIAWAALLAFRAFDVRRFAAYAALIPGGVFALGVAGLTPMSILGSSFQLIAGGLAAALAVAVGAVIADRAQTREVAILGGLGPRTPRLAWLLILAVLAVIGAPGMATFVAELFEFLGSFANQPGAVFLVGASLALAAGGLAWTVQRVLFGRPGGDAPGASDSNLTETWYLGILVAALLWWGILPGGPKIGGSVILFDQGIVNVINNSSSDLAQTYAPPAK
jgi:NADH-quinone oxidoreductase subunit M